MNKNIFFYKKVLPIIIIFLVTLFTFTNSVFANSLNDNFKYPEGVNAFTETYDNKGNNCNQVLYLKDNTYYMLVWFIVNGSHDGTSLYMSGIPCSTFMDSSSYNHCVLYKYDGTNWNSLNWWYTDFSTTIANSDCAKTLSGAKIVTSSSNIYTDETLSEVFFQLTPQGITKTLVEETTKAQIMEQMKKTIVGFLKYLIVFVISLIAFWKGWQFLSMQLKKA